MLHPNQTSTRLLSEVVDQEILSPVPSKIPNHHSFQSVGLYDVVGLPLSTEFAGVLVPPDTLPPHPSGADDIRMSITIYIERAFVVVVDIWPVCLRAISVIGILLPIRRKIEVSSGRYIKLPVNVDIQHG